MSDILMKNVKIINLFVIKRVAINIQEYVINMKQDNMEIIVMKFIVKDANQKFVKKYNEKCIYFNVNNMEKCIFKI